MSHTLQCPDCYHHPSGRCDAAMEELMKQAMLNGNVALKIKGASFERVPVQEALDYEKELLALRRVAEAARDVSTRLSGKRSALNEMALQQAEVALYHALKALDEVKK